MKRKKSVVKEFKENDDAVNDLLDWFEKHEANIPFANLVYLLSQAARIRAKMWEEAESSTPPKDKKTSTLM